MSIRMGTLLAIFILIGGGYLCVQLFPTLFGITPTENPSFQSNIPNTKKLSLTSESAMNYVLATCGALCENCEKSLSNCSQLIIEKTAFFCQNGKKGSDICYYDFESLSNACRKICKP